MRINWLSPHTRFAADRGDDAFRGALVAGGKLAADDAGGAIFPRLQLAILRRRPAWRWCRYRTASDPGLSRTEYEAAAVGGIVIGEEFDMVDNAAVVAADPRGFQPSRTARA